MSGSQRERERSFLYITISIDIALLSMYGGWNANDHNHYENALWEICAWTESTQEGFFVMYRSPANF